MDSLTNPFDEPIASAQNDTGLRWRFELDSAVAGREVASGPDGVIYASDDTAVSAISADGSFLWTRPGLGDGTPISFLSDGAIIVGNGQTVWALETDGTTRWTFEYDGNDAREHIEVGPSVGPDGNIYAVTSVDGQFGLGAFSLAPDGTRRWSQDGDPSLYNINGTTGGPVFFSSDRLYFHFNNTQDTPPHNYGFDFDGDQTLYVDFTCTSVPRVDPFDRLILSGACGIEAIRPGDQSVEWTVDLGTATIRPAIDETGTLYSGAFLGDLVAITPDGEIAWTSSDATDVAGVLGATADTFRVIYREPGFGGPTLVGIADSRDGTEIDAVSLLQSAGNTELVESDRVAFSPDATVIYFSTRFTGLAEPGAVYAVQIAASPNCAADWNGDDFVNTNDFVAYLNDFVAVMNGGDPNFGDPDLAAPFGVVNTADFLAFLNAFNAGCV